MLSVIEIVQQLNQAHATKVRMLLADDSAYYELTLPIFDAYRNGADESSALEVCNLKYNSFKIIERLIYRSVLAFYKVEDIAVKDIMQTNLFYAIYGSTQKTKTEKRIELDELFHQLKRFKIEQESAPLLNELKQLHGDTPLETVYEYMHQYYSNIDLANKEIIEHFIIFNHTLEKYINHNSRELLKELIQRYKLIRKTTTKHFNYTAASFCNSCKLSLAILAEQNQILIDGRWSIESLLSETKETIKNLPFGMMRFYLKNIITHIEYKHLINEGKTSEASSLCSKFNRHTLLEAYNFSFPNSILKEELQLKDIKSKVEIGLEIESRKNRLTSSFNLINKGIAYQFNKNYFGRERLSLFLN